MGSRMISCLLASRTVASNTGGIGDGYPKKIQPCGENRMKRKKMWAAITLVSGLLRYSKSNVQEQELQGFDLVVSMVVVTCRLASPTSLYLFCLLRNSH